MTPTPMETATISTFELVKFTELSVRMPAAATDPKSTMPAPPSTGSGIAFMTRPSTGSRPSSTRMPPPAATTNRLLMPVSATMPTFWAKALIGKPLKIGANAVAPMSARRPAAIRLFGICVPRIWPTASRSAVVSAMITKATTHSEMITPIANCGAPKWNGWGSWKTGPLPTALQVTRPMTVAMSVPTTRPSMTAMRDQKPGAKRAMARVTTRVSTASSRPVADAKFGFSTVCLVPSAAVVVIVGLPRIQRSATGNSEMPMMVITHPVTTGGKNRTRLANSGAMRNPNRPATITPPKIVASRAFESPRPAFVATAVIVPTAANDTPCTSGSRAPTYGTPSDCSSVPRPETNSAAVTRIAVAGPSSPAASAMMIGGETTPAYIARMCCSP